jgi:hypothetical protein
MRSHWVWLLAGALAVLFGIACQRPAPQGFDAPGAPAATAPSGDDAGAAPITSAVTWHQDPDSEILQCHYFKLPNDAAAEVARIKVQFPQGSHHVHVYHAAVDVPDHVENCTNIDWTTWSLVVGVQTSPIDWQLPDGVTVPIAPHEQLMVQVHWLNTTPEPIDREIDVSLYPTDKSTAHLGVVFGVAKDVYMVPGQSKSVGGFCPIPAGVNLTAMMGHFHARGTHYSVDLRKSGEATGQTVYEAADEQTFEFKRYDLPPVPQPGQGLVFQCDFSNTTDGVITWGANTVTQEHCNMAAYYYPATEPLSHLYLSGEIAGAGIDPGSLPVGQSADVHVQLKEQAGAQGVDVVLQGPSGGGVSIPGGVHVPGWAWGADFALQAATPGPTSISLTTGANVTTMPVSVVGGGGLVLSEVLYDPTSGPAGWQWVEIANVGATPVDLSGYSLAAGGSAYGTVRAGLGSLVLPPDGCLVVGGPNGLPAPDPAAGTYTVAEQLTPALPISSTPASGVALFDVPFAQSLPAGAVPVDAVVYGTANAGGLLGPDGQPAAPVPGAPPGASLERTTSWQVQPTPTPGICRVSHAQ